MHRTPLKKSIERICTSLSKRWAKPVAADVFHLVLIGKRWNVALWVLLAKFLIEEDKVGKTTTYFQKRLLKRRKVRLAYRLATGV